MRPLLRTVALLGGAVVATMLLACGGSDDPSPTPTSTGSPSPAATATSTATAGTARDIDFTDPSVIGPLIDHFGGGEVEPLRVAYLDVTGDGEDEAIAIVESGGTQGDLGAAVLHIEDGRPAVLGYIDAGGHIEVRLPEAGGVIVAQEGVWEPGDAACCPSRLRERSYHWSGDEFEVVSDQVVDNTDG